MKEKLRNKRGGTWVIVLFALFTSALFTMNANALDVHVVGSGGPGVNGFRWLLEEDNTNITVPGASVRVSISTDIHNSHAPVVAVGDQASGSSTSITVDASGNILDPGKQYFISVLPGSGYANSGTVVPAGATSATVTVHELPLPTAQISLLAFVDHNPINSTFDEHDQGLGGGAVLLFDTAGQVTQDAFGNPLGTQYQFNAGTGLADLDVEGNPIVTQIGNGNILTVTKDEFDAGGTANPYNLKTGEALIKYLVPGKYGVKVVPPAFDDDGSPMTWSQTSTIEGTSTVDAWVKANEPKLFVEGFGTGFNHVFFGFVKVSPTSASSFNGQEVSGLEWNQTPPSVTPSGTVRGTVRMNHFARPPELQGFYPGVPVANCWVGLNDPLVQPGLLLGEAGKYAAPCNEDSTFEIANVPPGTYQLVTWDTYLDTIFNFHTVTIPSTGGVIELGDLLTFRWFGTLENYVFFDANEDGFRQDGEAGIPEQNVNLRFRDGTIYQAFPTDLDGYVPFDEVFPFFKWLVVEVDFGRYKATGMTTAVDYGGPIPGPSWPADGNKNPQPQDPNDPFNEYGDLDSRTETGPVLTQAMHLFLGQANLIEWGKSSYDVGENGGISGMVFYAVTRAENDPRYAAAEEWEPGVPRVQVNLYEDMVVNATGDPGTDGIIDDLDGDTLVTLADVDNYPFQWAPAYASDPGYTGAPGLEDSDGNSDGVFDFGDAIQVVTTDSWDDNKPSGCIQDLPDFGLGPINECADGFGTWNQVRPGLFDGGYAFNDLPSGNYIVEANTPPGYTLMKEEDRNVDFGDNFIPSPLLLPAVCVGDVRQVPAVMSFDGVTEAPFAGDFRPFCDKKQVSLSTGQNAAADFFVFTQVPKAARAVGFVNNDLGAEFNQASPVYGEKLAAPWLPLSFRDWKGTELARVYTDEFGSYNAILPSTYTVNVPSPTGVSPSMITVVLNDPFLADGSPDPFYDSDYSVTPWTFHYFPGATSYLDTPIVPVAAFTTSEVRLDTGPANNTPVIQSVTTEVTYLEVITPAAPETTVSQPGPLVCDEVAPYLPANATITIKAPPGGTIEIRNPDYPANSFDPTVTRNVGFGLNQGTVTLNGASLPVTTWGDLEIQATAPSISPTGRILVTRSNGLTSEVGVTLNKLDCSTLTVHTVPSTPTPTIQSAIDVATAGDFVLVGEGEFNENVVMWKPVRLQGLGAGSFINANPETSDLLDIWHDRMDALGAREYVSFLLKDPFSAGEAPGVFVLGETEYTNGNLQNPLPGVQYLNPGNPFTLGGNQAIDGFTISGSKAGGGVFAVAGAIGLEVSNNNITNNQGNFAGGVAFGTPDSGFNANNNNVVIRNNKIHKNGGIQGGGGIAMNEGSADYLVDDNLIIGNFGRFNGGGIQHRGASLGDNVIQNNRVLFNEVFFGALLAIAGDGGGISISGDVAGGTGTGSVTIDGNLIQGNMSGSGKGGGIHVFAMNGEDIRLDDLDDTNWYTLNIINNIIVNNVAAYWGAGISLQDVARANIVNNTIARNDSSGTSSQAFEAGQANSTPQPSGLVTAVHSGILQGLLQPSGDLTYSNPTLENNIIYQNRSFYNDSSINNGAGGILVNPNGQYWDIHVIGSSELSDPHLDPQYSLLTSLTNPETNFQYSASTNTEGAPGFVDPYSNFIESATVLDEGGNAISIRFTPLAPVDSDYHIGTGQALDNGSPTVPTGRLATDFDGEPRPYNAVTDIGADEAQPVPALLVWDKDNPPMLLLWDEDDPPSLLTNGGGAKNARNQPGNFDSAVSLMSNPVQFNGSSSVTSTQVGSTPSTLASTPVGATSSPSGSLIARVSETVTEVLNSIVPGRSSGTSSSNTQTTGGSLSRTSDVPGFVNEESVTVVGSQPLTIEATPGNDVTNPVQNASIQLLEQNGNGLAFSDPAHEGSSISGAGSERLVSVAKVVQSGTNLTGSQQQDEPDSLLLRYSLVGLIIAGLAIVFFLIVVPKIIQEREQ